MRISSIQILILATLLGAMSSCLQSKKKGDVLVKAAKGDRYYGGVFKYNETEYYRSLYPLNITEVVGHRISTQIYEGLVKFNQSDLSIQPALASNWVIQDNATRFTFTIRPNVYFHDDPCFPGGKGRLMNIKDIEFCLKNLCTYDANNQGYWSVQGLIVGSENFYNTTKWNYLESQLAGASDSNKIKIQRDIEEVKTKNKGIKTTELTGLVILNDSTLEIRLESPFAGFLNRLALPFASIFPPEAFLKYGTKMRDHAVGTGPFYVKTIEQDISVILRKHEKYWGRDSFGNTLPYLSGVKISFIAEEKTELIEFNAGNLDLKYRIPLEMIDEVMTKNESLKPAYSKFQLQRENEMSIQYYGFLHTGKIFNNIHLRRAFNYAIDRQKLCDFTLKGQGVPADDGIVPKGFAKMNYAAIKGYTFDPALAKEHLTKAGYPNGKGLPQITLQINSGGGRNEALAEAIQKMLEENLNIDLNITQLVWAQHTENLETSKSDFYRLGWVADYPDPENFLNLIHSMHIPKNANDKAYINSFRYRNPAYDALYDEAKKTIDEDERYALYTKMSQIIVDDAVVMPIYCPKIYRLLSPHIRNLPLNAMEYRNLEAVWKVN
ncbi:MAG: ABC transporter substrate-binding protein [Bacteroidetes bacterium]|nr:ABC transporter substrate-binding protein [Bacteroidota bacterium]